MADGGGVLICFLGLLLGVLVVCLASANFQEFISGRRIAKAHSSIMIPK